MVEAFLFLNEVGCLRPWIAHGITLLCCVRTAADESGFIYLLGYSTVRVPVDDLLRTWIPSITHVRSVTQIESITYTISLPASMSLVTVEVVAIYTREDPPNAHQTHDSTASTETTIR